MAASAGSVRCGLVTAARPRAGLLTAAGLGRPRGGRGRPALTATGALKAYKEKAVRVEPVRGAGRGRRSGAAVSSKGSETLV